MKKVSIVCMAMLIVVCVVWAQSPEGKKEAETQKKEEQVFKTDIEKASYCLGYQIAMNSKRDNLTFDSLMIIKGMEDAYDGKTPVLSENEMNVFMRKFQQEMMAKASEKRIKENEKFLEKNAKKEGVKVLESGLQYKVIEKGKGKSPGLGDRVKVHYRGTFMEGEEFDSSYKRGEPAVFGVQNMIKGWTEALQLMKEGAKWQLVIPSDLAYGESGMGRNIPPNSLLIFEIELIEVVK